MPREVREVRQRIDESDEEVEVERNVALRNNSEGANTSENEEPEQTEDGANDEDDDEIYEIERIVHHKKGYLAPGKMCYCVKWKGYPESENSWVLEEDCNAPDLISEYWANKGKARSSILSSKRGREVPDGDTKMTDAEEERRLKKSKKDTNSKSNIKDPKGKSRSSAPSSSGGQTKQRRAENKDKGEEEDVDNPQGTYGNMDEYWHLDDWTDIIAHILTVDYSSDSSNTVVYFLQMKDGSLRATTTEEMIKRAPSVAIRFFESNLRFRA